MTIRVIAADDQPLMLEAFGTVLGRDDAIELVAVASDGEAAVALALDLRPDVALLDVRMPKMNGVEATKRILAANPDIKVLILTTFDVDEYVVEALRAGASGFLLKDVDPPDLLRAIEAVAHGDAMLAPSVTRRLLDSVVGSLPPLRGTNALKLSVLTDAELRVLTLVGKGLSNDDISRELFVSPSTVRTHLRHAQDKLKLRNRVQAVVFAYDCGLVQVDPR